MKVVLITLVNIFEAVISILLLREYKLSLITLSRKKDIKPSLGNNRDGQLLYANQIAKNI